MSMSLIIKYQKSRITHIQRNSLKYHLYTFDLYTDIILKISTTYIIISETVTLIIGDYHGTNTLRNRYWHS